MARWIIHTAGPIYSGSPDDATAARELPDTECLRVADELGPRRSPSPPSRPGSTGTRSTWPPRSRSSDPYRRHRRRRGSIRPVRRRRRGGVRTVRRLRSGISTSPIAVPDLLMTADLRPRAERSSTSTRCSSSTAASRTMGRGPRRGRAIRSSLNAIMAGSGSDLDASKPVVVICERRSRPARHHDAAGSRVRGLQPRGRIEAWAREGLPYAAPDGSPGPRRLTVVKPGSDTTLHVVRPPGRPPPTLRCPLAVVRGHDVVHPELEQGERPLVNSPIGAYAAAIVPASLTRVARPCTANSPRPPSSLSIIEWQREPRVTHRGRRPWARSYIRT